MKKYTQVFQYALPVQQVVDTLFQRLAGHNIDELPEGITQENTEYHHRIVEAVIDPIVNNPNALGRLFNALNGWVQVEIPVAKANVQSLTNKAAVYNDNNSDELWDMFCNAKYIGMLCQGQNVVGIVNFVDNGINISFKLKNVVRGIEARKLYNETIHISDMTQAEEVVAYPANGDDYEEYLRQIQQ